MFEIEQYALNKLARYIAIKAQEEVDHKISNAVENFVKDTNPKGYIENEVEAHNLVDRNTLVREKICEIARELIDNSRIQS